MIIWDWFVYQIIMIDMEWKIGEIFKYNGEWYQCIKNDSCCCDYCDFSELGDCDNIACASGERNDNKEVHFKKLEKVEEPFSNGHFGLVQKYKLKIYGYSTIDKRVCFVDGYDVFIKLKQTKEDMEDLDKVKVRDYTKVKELNVMEEKKLNLKPFDIQKAKEGKPVCTRDGRKARIVCFDRKFYHDGYNYPIVAMVNDNDNELVHAYTQDGLLVGNMEGDLDLMMLPEKKEGWVNVAKEPLGDDEVVLGYIFNSYEDAVRSGKANERYVATVRIEWEE